MPISLFINMIVCINKNEDVKPIRDVEVEIFIYDRDGI